ncbi:MAG: histidine--tRNA ligase [Candidatus Brocadiia bacterium]
MSEQQIQSIAGTEDVLPSQWAYWRRLYGAAERLFERYGYGRIRTPVLEERRLFIKGTGETTDVVQKEMYTIPSGGDEDDPADGVSLRPEGTPPVIRSYLEHSLHKGQTFRKLYYVGPMFRHERPQRGRLRQFHQLGVEAVGSASPLLDVETILLAAGIFREAGLEGFETYVNSMGCSECRPGIRDRLRELLRGREEELCGDCVRRLDRNVFRVLDCKKEPCRQVTADLPPITGMLCEDCSAHHDAVRRGLEREGATFQEDPHLVRGLDYYTRTVYEIKHPSLGARDTICGGGRYDDLVELLGGPSLPCVGFAIGAEPTLLAMEAELGPAPEQAPAPEVYIVCFEDEVREECFALAGELRRAGVSADLDYEGRSAKSQMRVADRSGAPLCFLIGGREVENEEALIKDMATGEQWTAPRREAAEAVRSYLSDKGG